MDRIWVKHYEHGVPADIDLQEFKSLGDVFEKSAARFAGRIAYINMGKSLTYAQVEEASRNFASFLENELKLPKGSRVAIMLPNCLQDPIAIFGVLRAGYTVVNVNPLYTPRELAHQLKDSGAEAIVILENFAHTLQAVLDQVPVKHIVTTQLGDLLGFPKSMIVNFVVKKVKKMVPPWSLPGARTFQDALAAGSRHTYHLPDVGHDDLAFLQYTGGTTGVAKGAMLTHRNILANMQQISAWLSQELKEGQETVVTALPLYHIFALTVNCMAMAKIGAQNVLITNPRDFPAFIKELGKYPASVLTGVNTLFNALLNHPDFAKLDFSALKVTIGGGMAVQHAVADRWKKVTGVPLIEGYGLTEASPVTHANPLNITEYSGSIGLALPGTDVELRDDAGKPVALGERGELCIRGPQVMKGYWQRPEETAKVIGPDGFLATGDVAVMDERGYVKIVDRKKDMILVSGFNVYPNEVEDVVAEHPGVTEVAAVGIPDEKSGEAVKIFVVRKDPALTEEALLAFCRDRLTGYKMPRHVEFRLELPKTNVGKILRRELRG